MYHYRILSTNLNPWMLLNIGVYCVCVCVLGNGPNYCGLTSRQFHRAKRMKCLIIAYIRFETLWDLSLISVKHTSQGSLNPMAIFLPLPPQCRNYGHKLPGLMKWTLSKFKIKSRDSFNIYSTCRKSTIAFLICRWGQKINPELWDYCISAGDSQQLIYYC